MLTRREIAQRVVARRHDLSLSQEALAELAEVSRETIRRLEQGGVSPNLATFGRIADALGMSAALLLAERTSDELSELVLTLPEREQENVVVMLRALSQHLAAGQ